MQVLPQVGHCVHEDAPDKVGSWLKVIYFAVGVCPNLYRDRCHHELLCNLCQVLNMSNLIVASYTVHCYHRSRSAIAL